MLAITSGSLKALNVSVGAEIGLSSHETGVDVSDDLLLSDGRRANSLPKEDLILKLFQILQI